MLPISYFCLAATIAASQMVNLLLPGFQGRSLEASIKEKVYTPVIPIKSLYIILIILT
jgi:hypothetical protein